jgi:hypothetical protein
VLLPSKRRGLFFEAGEIDKECVATIQRTITWVREAKRGTITSLAMMGSLFGFRARCGRRYDYMLYSTRLDVCTSQDLV